MPGFKGRALIYPGLLIAGWIIGRSLSLSAAPVPSENAAPESHPLARQAQRLALASMAAPPITCPSPFERPAWQAAAPHSAQRRRTGMAWARERAGVLASENGFGPLQPSHSGGTGFDLAGATSGRAIAAVPQADRIAGGQAGAHKPKRLQAYGYSFWRHGSAGAPHAPYAQYGSSQFGIVTAWDPFGSAGQGPALLLRASGTPGGAEREIALGARWQPRRNWPVSLSLERRFRADASDSLAAYVAGGANRVPLTGRLALDAYGQAGYALGGQASLFIDAQARLQHPLAAPFDMPLRIGSGVWIGGQKGAFRADIGPTLTTEIDSPITRFTLHLDWRKRITGNAAPGDGVALTVSTGF